MLSVGRCTLSYSWFNRETWGTSVNEHKGFVPHSDFRRIHAS